MFAAMTDATSGSGLGGGMTTITQYNFPVNATGTGLYLPQRSVSRPVELLATTPVGRVGIGIFRLMIVPMRKRPASF
jgi:hypothetical protein